jgi:FkbM family methyltransferase
MLQAGLCEVTGFEPLPEALAELEKRRSPRERYLPYVVADGQKHQLRICKAGGMTSLFEPDMATLSLFDVLKDLGQVVARTEVESRRLDDIAEITSLDFLKMDIQGSELMVLQHGRNKLRHAVAVQAEVSFITLYHNQPAMGEIDGELRRQGFIPHCYAHIKKWPVSPLVINNDPRMALNQLLEADIVYIRDIARPDLLSDEQLKHLALVAHYCYRSFDVAAHCLNLLMQRSALSANALKTYLRDG